MIIDGLAPAAVEIRCISARDHGTSGALRPKRLPLMAMISALVGIRGAAGAADGTLAAPGGGTAPVAAGSFPLGLSSHTAITTRMIPLAAIQILKVRPEYRACSDTDHHRCGQHQTPQDVRH